MKISVDDNEGGWCVVLAVQMAEMVVRGAGSSRERVR